MLAMTTAILDTKTPTRAFDVEDVEYLRHGDQPLMARVFKPRGEGPFPALVECHDARYAAIALPAGTPAQDASVRCVVMSWPVINPYSRYRHAKRALASPTPPDWPKSIISRQDAYWK